MSVALTYEEAVSLATEAVAEKGADYVYPRAGNDCRYFESSEFDPEYEGPEEPSCLVGWIFAKKGIKYADMVRHEASNELGITDVLNGTGLIELPDDYLESVKLRRFLQVLQQRQDEGETWGSSLQYAKDTLEAEISEGVLA